jgi:hypothetical protein
MYRNTTVGSLPLGLSRRLLAQCFATLFACLTVVCGLALAGGLPLQAQSTSGGGIQGSISDPSGAAVANAQVTATNTDTGVATIHTTSGSGTYSIQPLPVGTYNVEVVAKGFQRLLQENINVDNDAVVGLNLKLTVGGEETTITITAAPPMLDTTDAVLGGTIENQLYSSLPLSMNGGPRDPTAFQYLMPGVQENPGNNTNQGTTAGSSGIYGGTGQTNLNANYVEGVPVSNINAQGSGTSVANAVSVDAVNQFSVQTSGASTSFGGAGVTNYTIQSGGNQFHGTVFDFVRNTMFDTWGYFSKVPAASGFAVKPGEHQNSYGGSIGGPIIKDKLFFFGSYEGYHYTKISNTPQYITVPTMDNRVGNFTDKLGTISQSISDPTSASNGARPAFQGNLNGVPTLNVIPSSEISNISLALQAALPAPTNNATFSNYLASLPLSNQDYTIDVKIDYTLDSRNHFSITSLGGLVGYGSAPNYTGGSAYSQLPVPYAAGTYTNQKTATGIIRYTYNATQSLINALSYGYTRNWGEGFSLTKGKSFTTPYAQVTAANPTFSDSGAAIPTTMPSVAGCNGGENACALGINNLPPGGATENMPSVSFNTDSGPQAPSNWSSNSNTGPVATNSYTVIDNLTWIKGRHNITFGAQVQWLENNGGTYGGYSQSLSLTYHAYDTAGPGNGDTYASFLVGAVYGDNVKTQTIQDVGARYRPMSPYVQDNWQVSPKLTLNLGIRYDYLQPYHEVHDRIAFLNSTMMNPIVGVPGVLEYAGFPNINNFTASTTAPFLTAAQEMAMYAPYICHCSTPVHPYNNNWEPRLGFAYAYTPSTVFSGAFSLSLTHSGGVGGGSGALNATGNNSEYSASSGPSQSGSTGNPAFFLNPNYFSASSSPPAIDIPPTQGTQGTPPLGQVLGPPIACLSASPACSAFSAIPPWTAPGVNTNPLATTGSYDFTAYNADHLNDLGCSASGSYCNTGAVNYADPYYGGRGPQYISYNLSIQKMINKKAVLTVAYSGSETHFLPGGAGRGFAFNTFSPDYSEQFSGALTGTALVGGITAPFPRFAGPAATFAQALRPFPQFSSCSTANMAKSGAGCGNDLWGNTGNANYNSLQVTLVQRPWHNLQGMMNYTRAKEIDNTGYHRTQFPVGPQDGNFVQNMPANRVDRSLGTSNQTNGFNLIWSYAFPIGRGQAFFATNRIAGLIGGGWEFSGLYKYRDGVPLSINLGTNCMVNAVGGQGICEPDYTPGFNKRQARVNGRWGRGPGSNATNFNTINYLNTNAFESPDSSPTDPTYTTGTTTEPWTTYKMGNIATTAPYGIHGPGWWDVDLGIRRTFSVRETATLHLTFQIEADVSNATNSTFFNVGSLGLSANSASPSTNWNSTFGQVNGQNQQIAPRDWQFAGRFRF